MGLSTSGQNLEIDASIATISQGGSGGLVNTGSAINTLTYRRRTYSEHHPEHQFHHAKRVFRSTICAGRLRAAVVPLHDVDRTPRRTPLLRLILPCSERSGSLRSAEARNRPCTLDSINLRAAPRRPWLFSFFSRWTRVLVAKYWTKLNHGPGRIRAEKGAADAGTVHAYCAGQPGSLVEFRHSDVKL